MQHDSAVKGRLLKNSAAALIPARVYVSGARLSVPLLFHSAAPVPIQDDLSMDCDGTADGETYARLGRCLEAPTFNILSNNNRQGCTQVEHARRKCRVFARDEAGGFFPRILSAQTQLCRRRTYVPSSSEHAERSPGLAMMSPLLSPLCRG